MILLFGSVKHPRSWKTVIQVSLRAQGKINHLLFVSKHKINTAKCVKHSYISMLIIFVFEICPCVCVLETKQSVFTPCRVLTLQGCGVTWRLINSVLVVLRLVPTAPAAVIKRDALKGLKTLPIHSWYFLDVIYTHTHTHTKSLDQNGCSFNSQSFSLTGSFSSRHVLFLDFYSFTFFICVLFFSSLFLFFQQTLVCLPLLSFLSTSLCARLHIKADDRFLTVLERVFYLGLCVETKIISMNMEEKEKKKRNCFYGIIQPSNIHISQTNLA